jgi:hypothetical protein
MFIHFQAPGLLPCQSISLSIESLVIDLDQLGCAVQATSVSTSKVTFQVCLMPRCRYQRRPPIVRAVTIKSRRGEKR